MPTDKTTSPAPHAMFRGRRIDLVVDVRSRLEYWTGHLDGAKCVPLNAIDELAKRTGAEPNTRIMVYCAGGSRSAAAAARLKALGFFHVTDGGGMQSAASHYVAA